ncbi:MAG: hypothetical protein M3Q75_09375 [Gemmatimonadota bacterium]|nr:hypothetical protein [Gemmatimonadota bacterium]
MPKTLKLGITRLAEVWTHVDRVLTKDDDLEVSEADAVNRLLEIALPLAWAEIGKEPKTDAEVAEVKRLAEKVLADIRPEGAKKK